MQPFWIGGQKVGSTWSWIDETNWSYDNWHSGQPSGNGPCLMIGRGGSDWKKWNDMPCSFASGFVCQIPQNTGMCYVK